MVGAGAQYLGDRCGTGDDLAGEQAVTGGQDVLHPQFDGIRAEGGGQAVHLGLVSDAGLDGAEAAHGPAGWVVGANDHALDVGTRDPVGAGGEAGGIGDHGAAGRGVGATVEQQAGLDAYQVPCPVGVVAVPHAGRMPMHVPVERLLA